MFGRLLLISLAVMTAGASASFSLTPSVLHSVHAASLPLDQADQWLKELEVLIEKQEWKAAEDLARRVLEATKGEETPRRLTALGGLARTLEEQGGQENLESALKAHREALAIARALYKGDHQEVAGRLNNLAFSLDLLEMHDKALPLYLEGLEMSRRLSRGDHPDVAMNLGNVAYSLYSLGRSSEALPFLLEGLEMNRRLYKGDHPEVAMSLNNIAASLDDLGRSSEALPLYQESLEMYRRLFKGDHPEITRGFTNVAVCMENLARFSEALPLYQESLEMSQRLNKGDHLDVARGLSSLARGLDSLDRSSDALPLYRQALEMHRRLFKGDHPRTATSLNYVGRCLSLLGSRSEALPILLESLEMRRRLFKGDHPDVAMSLNNAAFCLTSLGRSGEALPKHQESLAMYRRLFGEGHPDVAKTLNHVSSCLDSLGRSSEALVLRREWLRGVSSFVQRSSLAWEGGVDRRAEGYASQISSLPQKVFESEQGLVCEARFHLREAASLSRALSSIPEDAALRDLRHAMLESKVAAERAAFGGGDAAQALRKADADYVRYSQALEARHGDRLRLKAPSLGDLQSVLGSDSLAVDVHRRTDRAAPYYVAVVFGSGPPRFVELGSEAAIQSELRRLSGSFTKAGQGLGAEASLSALDRLTLGRLDPYLKGKTKLHLAVDGVLAQVPFPALISGTVPDAGRPGGVRSRHRVEGLQISLLPSVLNLAVKSFGSGAKGSVLVGGVDYESAEGRSAPSGFKPLPAIPSGTRGLPSNGRWGPLSASSSELESLKSLPAFSQAQVFSGPGATEPALMAKIQSPRYLHFSTHAFFVPRKEGAGKGARLDQISSSDDPMHRSALVLAGANAQGALPQNDGYLLASEASRLSLSGTRLVTLGACESGLGDSSVGQGILGLRRAFRSAGAQGVVMSLYVVPDVGTADLMKRLYSSLGKGMTAPAALRQAQLSMLLEGQGVFSWGLFVYEGTEK